MSTTLVGAVKANDNYLKVTGTALTACQQGVDTQRYHIVVGTERMYVREVDGDQVEVLRGVDGTTAADHADGATVTTYLKTNSGTGTIAGSASTGTITHGLGGTPSLNDIRLWGDGNEVVWASGVGSTTFTINRNGTTGTRNVYWSARCA